MLRVRRRQENTMPDFSNTEGVIAAGAAIWAATNAVLGGSKTTNERRDAVITGFLGSQKLTQDHRHLILWNDWAPMVCCLGLLCLAIGAFIFWLPWHTSQAPWYFYVITTTAALSFLAAAGSFLIGGYFELRAMNQCLLNANKA